jgi:hypothetical protein
MLAKWEKYSKKIPMVKSLKNQNGADIDNLMIVDFNIKYTSNETQNPFEINQTFIGVKIQHNYKLVVIIA